MTRSGVTLPELLVALALTALLGTLLLGLTRSTLQVGASVDAGVAEDGARRVAAALLRRTVEAAGRGGLEPALRLELGAAGSRGDVVRAAYLREAWRAEPAEVRVALFADRDSAGRANLYRRPEGSVKQPLVLGVRGMRVVGGVTPDGRRVERADLADGMRLHALRLQLRFGADGADGADGAEAVTAAVRFAPRVGVSRAPP